ncbi:Permease of the drug/metabolite transporter (DMT) superfamily [Pseudomonas sp. R3-52-08]|nr:Permease of the drug/metabolite transporter (DMT) superfamily [Pseudomonas sp. R3-52-08]
MIIQPAPSTRRFTAIALSALANLMLGASSLYWRALDGLSSATLVAYRIVLSCLILSALLLIFRRLGQANQLTAKLIALHGTASIFIAVNWATFMAASINGYILESGIGYLLAPFIPITLGALIYHEQFSAIKTLSIAIALVAILLLITFTEKLNHWVYLLIAATWGVYTYLKKYTPLNAVTGLFLETVFLSSCIVVAVWIFDFPIIWPSEVSYRSAPLIWLAGAVSVTPLLMFSFATGKIPLSLTGFLQFILPLTLLAIGLITNGKNIPTLSLTLIISTTGVLVCLLAYDSLPTRSPKE